MKPVSFAIILLCVHVYIYAQAPPEDSTHSGWSSTTSAYQYFIPGEKMPPTLSATADNKALHLETRYNYEDINSASFFGGRNFEKMFGGADVTATPMMGFVAGRSNGLLPGFELNVDYKMINFYSENEYMLSFKGDKDYFFYSWTELNAKIFNNVSAGILAQTLRWFKTDFSVQHGVYAEYSRGIFTVDVYYFNPFTKSPFGIFAFSVNF